MKRFNSKNKAALLRAAGIFAAVAIIISGVTFAILQSQQDTLTGNTIETATANLQLSTDGINYSDSHAGFDFNNLIPGGQPVPASGRQLYLKNQGGTELSLRLAITSQPTNPNNVDLNKVNILLTSIGTAASTQSFTLQSLITDSPDNALAIDGVPLSIGAAQQFKLQVSMDADAVSGSVASLGNIDFSFSGAALTN